MFSNDSSNNSSPNSNLKALPKLLIELFAITLLLGDNLLIDPPILLNQFFNLLICLPTSALGLRLAALIFIAEVK